MTFLVDANVVVYAAVDSPYRTNCAKLLAVAARGDADGRMSTAVLEEIWHLELSGKAGDLSGLTARAFTLFTPLLSVTDATISRALTLEVSTLGANDRIHVATCLENEIEAIVTADAGFDGIAGLRRVDPLDDSAVQALVS